MFSVVSVHQSAILTGGGSHCTGPWPRPTPSVQDPTPMYRPPPSRHVQLELHCTANALLKFKLLYYEACTVCKWAVAGIQMESFLVPSNFVYVVFHWTRMHCSRVRTAHFSGRLSSMHATPCHACPPRQTHPLPPPRPSGQKEWHTLAKTLPSRNYCCGR